MSQEVVIIPTVNSRTQRLLASYMPKMSATMQAAGREGRLQYSDSYYFKRVALPASANGMQDLLLNDDAQKDGYCTISKQKIDQGCAMMVDRVTFKAFAIATSSLAGADEGSVSYTDIASLTSVPALQDAELEFTVNGKRMWKAPVNAFNHETTNSNSAKDGINLVAPCFVNDEQLLQFRLHLPQGKSIDATLSVFVEVCMFGAECRVIG